jgi:hypothetical protein
MTHHVTLLRIFSAVQHVKHILFGAPGQLLSLARQQRDRTAPLATDYHRQFLVTEAILLGTF